MLAHSQWSVFESINTLKWFKHNSVHIVCAGLKENASPLQLCFLLHSTFPPQGLWFWLPSDAASLYNHMYLCPYTLHIKVTFRQTLRP